MVIDARGCRRDDADRPAAAPCAPSATGEHGLTRLTDTRRLAALTHTDLLDTPPEEAFDRLTRLASRLIGAPVSLISLIDRERQFFKSEVGLRDPWASLRQTPLSHSFCQHVVATEAPLVIDDARATPLVRDNLAIPDLGVEAYLGVPLSTPSGDVIGSFCIIDNQPRHWRDHEVSLVTELAQAVMVEIEVRWLARELRDSEQRFRALVQSGSDVITVLAADGTIVYESPSLARTLGYEPAALVGQSAFAYVHASDIERVTKAFTSLTSTPDAITHIEFRFRHADSTWRYLEAVGTNRLADPAVQGIIINSRDVTERKALQDTLAAHAEQLETTVAIRTRDLEQSRLETLERLALAAEYRDDVTGEHTQRVGMMAAELAAALGLPDDQVALIGRAAPLHDIGKIGIPDRVLLKAGSLDPAEWALMKSHTTIGERILGGSSSPTLQLAAEIALAHHERWDGTGYPHGLAAHAIPLTGRIVAVADVFDALTHARPYKAAWSVTAALQEITNQRGRQFDPEVAEALLVRMVSG